MASSRIDIRPAYRRGCLLLAALLVSAGGTLAQAPAAAGDKPLPDLTRLLTQVEANQQRDEALQKDYVYRSATRLEELGGNGQVKKIVTRTDEYAYVEGVLINRELTHDGKPLTPDEQKKEDERVQKAVAKAHERQAKAAAVGRQTDPSGHDEITVSRILELGTLSNPRRIQVAGRDTILADYTGNPKAKTHNPGEGAFKDLVGLLAIDEQDKAIQHLEGHFQSNYKVGGGLVANVSKGTSFSYTAARIRDEVWLPGELKAEGHMRYLLFFSLNGSFQVTFSDYRKFKASATILPGMTVVDSNADTGSAPDASAPVPPK